MAGPTEAQLKLIRDYEPALYFVGNPGAAGAERFFPSDAKAYLEKAALRSGATSDVWNSAIIEPGRISATEGAGGPGAIYLGQRDSGGVPLYLKKPDYFLDASGWKPGNQYANLDALADRYKPGGDLSESRFTYHAEFFNLTRLTRLFDDEVDPGGGAIQFRPLLQPQAGQPAFLTDPALICYYLFYPGHEESLSGCTDPETGVLYDKARDFASFAGEWSCIAILLDRAGPGQDYVPKYVGLTNRNSGATKVGDREVRTIMRLIPWSAVQTFAGNHPRFRVARGSHALYLLDETIPPVTLDDPSAAFCGSAGPLPYPPDEYGASPLAPVVFPYKIIAGAAVGTALGPFGSLIGAAAGAVWGIAELESDDHLRHISLGAPAVAPTVDATPSPGDFVICPVGVRPIDATGQVAEWRSGAGVPVDVFTVDRETQVLWGDDPDGQGYTGRWGQVVQDDPQARRSGMAFPKFWRLVFDTMVRNDKPARFIVLKPDSGASWTVPADWNNADNSIEAIGGGGGGAGGIDRSSGGGGGGGGEYRKLANLVFTPGTQVPFKIGAGGIGGAASINGSAGGDTEFNPPALIARGGKGGVSATPGAGGAGGTGGTGGAASFNGGAGGSSGQSGVSGGGGGGGAGGPNGAGASAASVVASPTAGGNADNNFGGAGGANADSTPTASSPGGSGAEIGGGVGSGGGGGGGNFGASGAGAPGGNFGGGGGGGGADTIGYPGGNGAPGVIIIRYTP